MYYAIKFLLLSIARKISVSLMIKSQRSQKETSVVSLLHCEREPIADSCVHALSLLRFTKQQSSYFFQSPENSYVHAFSFLRFTKQQSSYYFQSPENTSVINDKITRVIARNHYCIIVILWSRIYC